MSDFYKINIVTHDIYRLHDTSGDKYHPEKPGRITSVVEHLKKGMLSTNLNFIEANCPEREWILKIHNNNYLLRFEEACLAGKEYLAHPDNRISYNSFEAAFYSCGSGLTSIDYVEKQTDGVFFCLSRPPGHHSETSLALGFCFINNVAVAAKYWQEKYNRERIFVLDFDAHHGNGIQASFEEDPSVFYASIHEHPTFSFPGTGYADDNGSGKGIGATLNIPLKPGSGDKQVLEIMDTTIYDALERFKPDAIIVAAGFDAHIDDDMSGLTFSTRLYGEIGMRLFVMAKKFCDGRIISILEGGYNINALCNSIETYLAGISIKTGE
jgi:acetoin utilization deacetylase AcuC-like enzyme